MAGKPIKLPPKPTPSGSLEDVVEAAIRKQLAMPIAKPGDTAGKGGITFDEMSRAIANAIRWSAVKAKIVTGDHGSGFEEED